MIVAGVKVSTKAAVPDKLVRRLDQSFVADTCIAVAT